MNAPGLYSLGDFTITSAGTQVGDWVEDLDGMLSVSLDARLAYGAGGTSIAVVIQTSLNQGTTAIDVARFDFTTAGVEKVMNLSGLTARTTALSVTSLGSEGANDGVLGDRLRAVITSVGTYSGSTVVSIRAVAR